MAIATLAAGALVVLSAVFAVLGFILAGSGGGLLSVAADRGARA